MISDTLQGLFLIEDLQRVDVPEEVDVRVEFDFCFEDFGRAI